MIRVYGLVAVLGFAFLLYCLLDVVLTDASLVRNLPKPAWVLLIVVVPVIGGLVWLLGGRPQRATIAPGGARSRPQGSRDHPSGRRRRARPKGPDDDPEFLRSLEDRLRREDDDEPDAT